MGTLALGAGAADDVTAWALLAIVLASYKHDMKFALFAIGGGTLFAIVNFTLGKRVMKFLSRGVEEGQPLAQGTFLTTMLFLFCGAYITDAIGVYAVFGAFMVGAAMPRGQFVEELRDRIVPLTVSCLLPFFFVYSGLNTKFGLLNSPTLWGICALACAAAMIGKFGGCTLASKAAGESWRTASAIGTLMNSRGLMELIILNIGRQQHVISDTLFTMLVIMAIITTLMASPLFKAILGADPGKTVRALEGIPEPLEAVGAA
jgi:Kef-type K+ transport system membrane component KefB